MSNQRQPRYHFLAMYAQGPRSALYREYKGILHRIARKSGYSAAEVENMLYVCLHPDHGRQDAEGNPTRTAYKRRFHDLEDMERYLTKVFFNAVLPKRARPWETPLGRNEGCFVQLHPFAASLGSASPETVFEAQRRLELFLRLRLKTSRFANEKAIVAVLLKGLQQGEELDQGEIVRRSGVEQSGVSRWLKRLREAYDGWKEQNG